MARSPPLFGWPRRVAIYSLAVAVETLGISVKTIEAHRASIMKKLRLRSVGDLVRYAIRNEIVQS